MTSKRPEIGSRVGAWNSEFEWTADHRTVEELRPMIFTYDELATRCLDRFDALPPLSLRASTESGCRAAAETCPLGRGHLDFYTLLREHAPEDATLQQLWDEVNTVPDWVDWDQIERGQRVFYRYAGPCIVGLTFQSLLGGLGSARVVETLARTGGFGVRVARRRLLDTLQHILLMTRSLPSLQPGGEGFASTIRVRFLHASVRRRILRLAEHSPSYFPTSTHGIPINDLDTLATTLAFSASLMHLALPRQGIHPTAREAADYLALWRYVAYLLGCAPMATAYYLSTPRLARAAMESLILTELAPSAASRKLAGDMLRALARQPPMYASEDFLRAQARWLNGPALADALGVGPVGGVGWGGGLRGWYYELLVAAQCVVFVMVCYARRSVRAWDEAGVERMRRVLWRFVLAQTGGRVAMHEMKYVPKLGKGVGGCRAGAGAIGDADGEGDVQAVSGEQGVGAEGGGGGGGGVVGVAKGVEERSLRAVLVASVVVGWVAWLGIRRALGMLDILR